MPAVLTLAVLAAQCVPARWFSGDPQSLDLLKGSPVNCLVVDKPHWTTTLVAEAHRRGLKMIALGEPQPDADALVTDGAPSAALPTIVIANRDRIHPSGGIVATTQAVWPGIRVGDDAIATPSSAPWVDTDLGYLRYLRSQVSDTIWLMNRPPPGKAFSARRYQQVMCDAALAGAHWVIDLDQDTTKRLLANDPAAKKDWGELMQLAAFLHTMPDVRALNVYSTLGVSVAPQTGAFVSGGVLDMIGAQHIPFQVVKTGAGMQEFFDFADDSIVKFPKTSLGRVQVLQADVDSLEPVYRRVEVIVGRTNFGLRVFNGAGVLSAPYALPGGKGVLVPLVNYTDYAAETITLHVEGIWKKATLETPGKPPKALNLYSVKTATAVEIDTLGIVGFVRVE